MELTIANLSGARAAISRKSAVRKCDDRCSSLSGPIMRSLPARNSFPRAPSRRARTMTLYFSPEAAATFRIIIGAPVRDISCVTRSTVSLSRSRFDKPSMNRSTLCRSAPGCWLEITSANAGVAKRTATLADEGRHAGKKSKSMLRAFITTMPASAQRPQRPGKPPGKARFDTIIFTFGFKARDLEVFDFALSSRMHSAACIN